MKKSELIVIKIKRMTIWSLFILEVFQSVTAVLLIGLLVLILNSRHMKKFLMI